MLNGMVYGHKIFYALRNRKYKKKKASYILTIKNFLKKSFVVTVNLINSKAYKMLHVITNKYFSEITK